MTAHQTGGQASPVSLFPAPGYRGSYSGDPVHVGYEGSVWSASASGAYGVYLRFVVNAAQPSHSTNRADGFLLRCLSE